MTLTNVLLGGLIGVGVYLILADVFGIATMKTSKAMRNMVKQSNESSSIEILMMGVSDNLSKYLRVNEFRRMKMERDLKSASDNRTPEKFIADAIVKSVPIFLLAIPALFIMPVFMVLVVVLGIAVLVKELTSIQEKIKERREQIEYDLPHFISTIEKTLKYNRDVLSIMENYRENASDVMKEELDITIADMKTGNYESALTRFESRIGSSMVSDTVRGLISVIRGDDTDFYWAALSVKFSDIQRQNLKNKAVKIPGKINKLSMVLLFCFILIYFVVFGSTMAGEMGLLFSL